VVELLAPVAAPILIMTISEDPTINAAASRPVDRRGLAGRMFMIDR
jgi:hypothetical protein